MGIKSFLETASEAYYNGVPIISDEQFDYLANLVGWNKVGHSVSGGVSHPYRMYSLQKYYVGEDIPPLDTAGAIIETPKLDGAAVALIYLNGELTAIHTRGDGKVGQDISHLIPVFPSVPKLIDVEDFPNEIIQITGEVVAPKSVKNARNYASGALNLQDIGEFSTRDLTFVAYGLQESIMPNYLMDMQALHAAGFLEVTNQSFDFSIFPQDGKVFRINANRAFKDAGFTSSHPKGAYALKERTEGVKTKLLDVIWQVGKSGAVSPVALLEPVEINGAIIARATLHNIAYIESLNLEIGCDVEVIRSGEIIPRIVKRL